MSSNERWHGLDALRALALLLGLALHASMAYLPGSRYFWVIAEPQSEPLLGPLFWLIHLFRMPLFFLLAGFFAAHSLLRRGAWGFAKERARRLGLPLLLGWPPVMAAIVGALVLDAVLRGKALSGPPPEGGPLPLAHLWFLYLLLTFSAAALLLRRVLPAALARWTGLLARPWMPLLLALPVAAALVATPYWVMWFGVPTPDYGLAPRLASSTSYGLAFAVGWGLQQSGRLTELGRFWPWLAAVALGLIVFCLTQVGLQPKLVPAAQDGHKLAYALAYAAAAWCLVYALIGLAQRHLAQPRPWVRALAEASYWTYLAHLPLLIVLQALLRHVALPPGLKFLLACGLCLGICLLSWRLLMRRGAVGRLLGAPRMELRGA